jgi:nucleolar protein 6
MGSSKKQPDATRQERKARKRKLEDAVPDLPGDNDEAVSQEKSGKKRKRDRTADVEEDEEDGIIGDKEKKERKKEKKRRRKEAEEGAVPIEEEVEAKAEKKEKKSKEEKKEKEGAVPIEEEVEAKAEKKEKKSKKEKKEKESAAVEPVVAAEAEEGPKKSKKERKAERKAKEAAEATAKGKDAAAVKDSKAESETNGDSKSAEGDKKSKKNNRNREKKRKGAASSEDGVAVNGNGEKDESKGKKDARFICFIGKFYYSRFASPTSEMQLLMHLTGNLPFTANTASVTKHFASVKPISVRALTKKEDPTKSKGIAFVEFDGYDHMKTCLKLFHHSMFDDGLSAPRKINVELTYVSLLIFLILGSQQGLRCDGWEHWLTLGAVLEVEAIPKTEEQRSRRRTIS